MNEEIKYFKNKIMKTYWISFAKKKVGNLGCCIIDAVDQKSAIDKTKTLGIFPGGEALLFELPTDGSADQEINQWGKNILITPDLLKADGYQKVNELELEIITHIDHDPTVTRICEKCNNNEPHEH